MRDERRGEMMRLGALFHPTGNHVAAWLHPEAQIDAGPNFRHYVQIAQTAERGKFDLMFVADAVAVRHGKLAALSRWPQYMVYFDPLTLLPAIAAMTTLIGVVATATTSYNEPYHVARKFASLDLISGGRAGWNVVTSSNISEAYNFGREAHYEHGDATTAPSSSSMSCAGCGTAGMTTRLSATALRAAISIRPSCTC